MPGVPARGHLRTNTYCFEPVVLLFGLGEQLRFCGFASFSQAAMLAYLQLSPPLADILMQNGEFPTVCDFCMLLPEEGEPIVPCAWAKEIPATSAATAVRVVNDFIVCLLVGDAGLRHSEQRKGTNGVPGTQTDFEKSFKTRRLNGKRPGKFPAARECRFVLRFDNSDDLVGTRINNHDLIADQDVVVTAPLWIDHDHLLRQRMDADVGRNARSDRH